MSIAYQGVPEKVAVRVAVHGWSRQLVLRDEVSSVDEGMTEAGVE